MKNDDYTFNLSIYNIAEKLLNFIAEITDCKQFILYVLIQKVINNKTIHNEKKLLFLKLIYLLQNTDVLTVKM